jgi:hydroxyethylthiazole kinase-like uncharacterized protein yjeF
MSAPSSLLNPKHLAKLMPKRPHDSHKGMFGTVAIIGGQRGMVGAPLMAARAALKLGAGCVHVGLLADNASSVDILQPELMLHGAAELLSSSPFALSSSKGQTVIAIGCGMGTDLLAHKLLHDALRCEAALILDADALNILAMRPDFRIMLAARNAPTVLTPHPGEAARLLDCKTSDIQDHRQAAAAELRLRLHSSVVLKGADSVCARRDGKLFINPTGNPGMSAAGMGDVLTGMIAAFLAQGLSGDDALCLAVYLHGAAGDELAKQQASIGMTASEVTEWARWLLNRLYTH